MSELGNAMRMLGNLPSNVLIESNGGTSKGKFYFVGSVDARLLWTLDGNLLTTHEEIVEACKVHQSECRRGTPAPRRRIKTRIYATKEIAIATAAALGLAVTDREPMPASVPIGCGK